jgi:hypothetical protein
MSLLTGHGQAELYDQLIFPGRVLSCLKILFAPIPLFRKGKTCRSIADV